MTSSPSMHTIPQPAAWPPVLGGSTMASTGSVATGSGALPDSGTGDTTPSTEMSTYLPPVRVPELAWREGDADERLTDQDREWWAKRGWRSRKGVRAYQAVRSVQHVLVNMLETKISDFAPPPGLSRMSLGDRRVWDEQEGRWYRGPPPLSGACHRTSMQPELPNTDQVPRFLLLTMDQKQTQWHMAHYMAMFFMCFFRGDLFHRAWNDFKWALKWSKGWFHHSMMQLCHAFNVNYGPFPRGGNTAKKQDIHMEWRALKPKPCDRLRAFLPQICMERGVPEPGTEADIRKAKARCIGLSRLGVVDTNVQQWASAHGRAWIPRSSPGP